MKDAPRPPVDPKWIRIKSDAAAVAEGCWFDLAAAERVREFFRRFIRHGTGEWEGQPFEPLEWQWLNIIAPLFAWKKPNGLRRFDRGYISTAKKNGKSTLLSALGLYFLLADGEPTPEVYIAAADKQQAGIIYSEAEKMVQLSAALRSHVFMKESTKTLTGPGHGFLRALSGEAANKDGYNASVIIFDELHAQLDRSLWDKLIYAGDARRQPLMLAITTAGSDLTTICGEQYLYAKNVLNGTVIDTGFIAFIAEADMKDDWTQESTWAKANPSLGETIKIEKFRGAFKEAKESPAKETAFRRYKLNQWVGTASAWLSMGRWDNCAGAVDANALAGRECFGGLDLSAVDDITALVLLFDNPDETIDLLPFFWLPEDNIDVLMRKHKVDYRAWARQGLFNLTPGNVIDYKAVRATVREVHQIYQVKELSIDRKFQGQQLESDLVEDGFNIVAAGQGWVSQDVPAKELERLVKAGRIRHGGHPVLRWHASNAVVDVDKNGNYTLNKAKARSKIDGIAATLMAMFCKMQGIASTKTYVESHPTLTVLD